MSLGAYIFQRPFLWGAYFWRALYSAYQWIGLGYSWKENKKCVTVPFLVLFLLWFFQVWAPCACIRRGDLMEGFLHYKFGELIFGEAYFSECYSTAVAGRVHCYLFKVNLYAVKKSHNNNNHFWSAWTVFYQISFPIMNKSRNLL